jgi:hypothetical protein
LESGKWKLGGDPRCCLAALGIFCFWSGERKRRVHTEDIEEKQRVHGERKTREREKRFGGV